MLITLILAVDSVSVQTWLRPTIQSDISVKDVVCVQRSKTPWGSALCAAWVTSRHVADKTCKVIDYLVSGSAQPYIPKWTRRQLIRNLYSLFWLVFWHSKRIKIQSTYYKTGMINFLIGLFNDNFITTNNIHNEEGLHNLYLFTN